MTTNTLMDLVSQRDVQNAYEHLPPEIKDTPLIRYRDGWNNAASTQIFLKLENLQPIGCFKLRGAYNALRGVPDQDLADGVYTASTGNFAQALSWCAKDLNIRCDVIVPNYAPEAKVKKTLELEGHVTRVTYDAWWKVIQEHQYDGMTGRFIQPESDPRIIAGNGTVGLEILKDLPDVDAVVVPYGGGALACGIAIAIKRQAPKVKVFACEVETAAPLRASFDAGHAVTNFNYIPSFVDGIGGRGVLNEMWPTVSKLLDGSIVVSLKQVADAMKLMIEKNHVVPEGAGAASLAAALTGQAGEGKVVCVVSGGNIDTDKVIEVLQGHVPDLCNHAA